MAMVFSSLWQASRPTLTWPSYCRRVGVWWEFVNMRHRPESGIRPSKEGALCILWVSLSL